MNKPASKNLSLRGLRTFSVAARHLSFTTAAEELFVTASAVSHQIKNLEDEMGVALFTRHHKGLQLTPTGETLFAQVAPLIRQLDEITSQIRSRARRVTLRISVQPFFASELFVPRLAEFTALHPDIDIHVDTSDESPEKHPSSAELSIRLFRTVPDNLASDFLFPLRVVPACSPALHAKIAPAGELTTEAFPIVVHTDRKDDWRRWSEGSGIELPEPSSVVHLNSMTAVVRAAEKGVGVALVPVPLSNGRLQAGHLKRLYPKDIATGDDYRIVYNPKSLENKAMQALRDWVCGAFADPG